MSFLLASPTYRPSSADGPKSKTSRPSASRNVSFTVDTRPAEHNRLADIRTASPQPPWPPKSILKQNIHRVNRREQNVDPNIMPTASSFARTLNTPFVVYSEEFSELLGHDPRLELTLVDDRAPYFHSGGAFISRLGTLFLTSNLLKDSEPSAAPSAYKRTEITKIDFYSSRNYVRDKVRCPEHSYMAAGVAEDPSSDGNGLIVCAQGSLKEPSGLVHIDTKRPHKSHMLLNNFNGKPFNSPCDIVANPMDGSVYFTDPAYGYERGHRPKPELPTGHIYRYEPESGQCRVVANGHIRPAGLAFSPDYSTLYVSELGDKYGGTTIFAYTLATTDPFRNLEPTFQISVSRNNDNSTTNHRSNLSNSSTSGSNSSSNTSQNGIKPSIPPTSFHRTQPLSPRMTPTNGSRPELKSIPSHSRGRSEANHISSAPAVQAPATNRSVPNLSQRPNPTPRRGHFLMNKRLFAYTPTYSAAGLISTAPSSGHLFLGTEEGVEVFSSVTGDLIGKIVLDDDEGLPISVAEPSSSTTTTLTNNTAAASMTSPKSPRHQPQSPPLSSFNPTSNIHPALRSEFPFPSSLASLSGLAGNSSSSPIPPPGDRPTKPQQQRQDNRTNNDEDTAGGNKKHRRKFQKGISKVAFGLNGEFWLLGGERLWKGGLDLGGQGGWEGLGWC